MFSDHAEWCSIPLFLPGVPRVPARPSFLGFRRRPGRAPREQNKADIEEESVPEIIAEVIVLSDTEDAVLEPERNGGGEADEASRLRVGDVSVTASRLRVGDVRSVSSCADTVLRPVLRLRVDEGNFGSSHPNSLPRTRWF